MLSDLIGDGIMSDEQYNKLYYDSDNLNDVQQLSKDAGMPTSDYAGIETDVVPNVEDNEYIGKQQSDSSVRLMLQIMEQGTKGQSNYPIAGAKLQKKLQTIKEKYKNIRIKTENAITDISKSLGARNTGTSNYINIEAKNGKVFTLRISNHNAMVSNFDNNGENNGISIVISRHENDGITNNGNAHVIEFFYSDKALNNADGTPIADIIGAIEQTLYSGEYKDPTGLAQVQEVNVPVELMENNNVGTFDGTNADIRYSIRKGEAPKNTGIGNLTAKTFYKTKEGVSQRAMTLSKSLHTTSETDGATLNDVAKIPKMFESSKEKGEKLIDASRGDDVDVRFSMSPATGVSAGDASRGISSALKDMLRSGKRWLRRGSGDTQVDISGSLGRDRLAQYHVDEFCDSMLSDLIGDAVRGDISKIDANTKKVFEILDKGMSDDVSLQEMSNVLKDIENDLRRGNKALLFDRFSYEELESGLKGERGMAEALSIVSGRGVRAGSQVEYSGLQQALKSKDKEVARKARIARDELNEQMEEDIENYARAKGIWIDNTNETLRERYGDRLASGGEGVVYFDEANNRVVKSQSTWTYGTLQDKLDAIALHNFLFPDTAYKLEGFGLDREGSFQVIVSQPYVVSNGEKLTQDELDDFARSIGFEKDTDGKHNYTNGRIKLRDLHNENVIRDVFGNIRVIDNVMRFADVPSGKSDGDGGRGDEYGVVDDFRFSTGEDIVSAEIEQVNDRFNNELQQQIDGTLPKGHIYKLGMPSEILLSAGFPNMPIEMSSTRLEEKSKQENHPFEISEMKNLVKELQSPIAVFKYGNNAKNVIIAIEYQGEQFLIGVHFNQNRNGIEVSSIRGIFPKTNAKWLNWIIQGKADYLDKEKIQTLINQQRTNLADVEYLDLDLVAKIVKDFENPSVEREKSNRDVTEYERNNRFADNVGTFSSDNEDIRYSIRKGEAPKNTGIGYKVFVLKNGKLYPPMVANPNGDATPVGVWLDADAAPIAGQSKTGRSQVKAGGKGTQGGGGRLAYRPGWHLGKIPYALQFNRNDENGERTLFPANFVWAEVEYANDVDYQDEAMSYGYNKNGKFQHSYAGLPRVPENGAYTYRTNPNPETDPWIITGAMKVKRLLTPTEVDEMIKAAGREPQPRQDGAVTDAEIEAMNAEFAENYSDEVKNSNNDAIKNRIEALFNQAISGEFNGKPISIGRLTAEGKAYLERISGISFKDKVDFVLNPSDLLHINKGHFGNNETDERNIPLDIEDIRSIADVVSSPDRIIYANENAGEKRKMFFFLKEAENGTYNLLEIYTDKKGNLTAKTFYKTKEGVSQRAMTLSKSLHTTSETDGATLYDDAKIPKMFESSKEKGEKLIDASRGDDVDVRFSMSPATGVSAGDASRGISSAFKDMLRSGKRWLRRGSGDTQVDISGSLGEELLGRGINGRLMRVVESWSNGYISLHRVFTHLNEARVKSGLKPYDDVMDLEWRARLA